MAHFTHNISVDGLNIEIAYVSTSDGYDDVEVVNATVEDRSLWEQTLRDTEQGLIAPIDFVNHVMDSRRLLEIFVESKLEETPWHDCYNDYDN